MQLLNILLLAVAPGYVLATPCGTPESPRKDFASNGGQSAIRADWYGNCKCQDENGQYNDATERCCEPDENGGLCWITHYPGPNHQCSAAGQHCLSHGEFEMCCALHDGHGAFCWN